MWIAFNDLPDTARIWIFQSSKQIDAAQNNLILENAKRFIDGWESHGKSLKGSLEIFHDRFVVIGVDEQHNPVTGCSTDASVNFVRFLGTELGIDFFDRLNLPILLEDRVELIPLQRFKKKDLPEAVTADSITFNNLIQAKGQLEEAWRQPVSETWLAKYLH